MEKAFIWLMSDTITNVSNWHNAPVVLIIMTLFAVGGSAVIVVISDSNNISGEGFDLEVKSSLAQRTRRWWRSLSKAKKVYAILAAACGIGAIVAAATGAGIPALGLAFSFAGVVAALLPPDRPAQITNSQTKRMTCVYVRYQALR